MVVDIYESLCYNCSRSNVKFTLGLQYTDESCIGCFMLQQEYWIMSTQITDKEGCYVLVKGFIDSKEVSLLNVYRPPGQDKLLI